MCLLTDCMHAKLNMRCKFDSCCVFPVADLIQCTNEMNVNIPQLADTLFERTTNTSWVVVFKSLITTHHLMVYGNEVKDLFLFWPSDR